MPVLDPTVTCGSSARDLLFARHAISTLGRDSTGGAFALPLRANPPQPFDQERIMRKRSLGVKECVQNLVILSGRHVEGVADDLFFGPRVFPPESFHVQNSALLLA